MANLGLASEDLIWFYMSVKISVFQLCSEVHQTTSSSIHSLFLRDKIFFLLQADHFPCNFVF